MLFLIGSRALAHYGRLVGREPADWDFIGCNDSNARKGFEISLSTEGTNREIYNYCRKRPFTKIYTPIGWALIAPLEILKVLKLSSVHFLDKAKHSWDLNQLADVDLTPDLLDLAIRREREVQFRVESQKDRFFNKYEVPRFVDHDYIHECINPVPIYTKILTSPTDVSEEKFLSLSLDDKIALVREECFVLVMERELIPKAKKLPCAIKQIVRNHSQTNTSATPAMRWLSRMSIVSKVKDHPPWLSRWTTENINLITDGFQQWWTCKLEEMPVQFWEQVLS